MGVSNNGKDNSVGKRHGIITQVLYSLGNPTRSNGSAKPEPVGFWKAVNSQPENGPCLI